MTKKALITGIAGQDGSYLAELLLSKGYEVHGLDVPTVDPKNITTILDQVTLHAVDLTNQAHLSDLVTQIAPSELYNLAAVSDLKTAREKPEYTMQVNFVAVQVLADALFSVNPEARMFQAGSAQMFATEEVPQNESTAFRFRDAYGEAKIKAHQEVVLPHRERGHYICTGFLYNHESPRRETRFVTRKITSTMTRISLGLEEKMEIGNVEAERDWSHAKDVMQAAWLMLQQDKADDYVVATGHAHSVKDFITAACTVLNYPLTWEGNSRETVAKNADGLVVVSVNEEWYRDDEEQFIGDPTKLKKQLGWQPEYSFEQLVADMVEEDLQQNQA